MSFLLDTDTIVAMLRGDRAIARRIGEVGPERIGTTTINLAELYFGAFNSRSVDENLEAVDGFAKVTHALGLDSRAAVVFGRIKATLRREGRALDDSDLFIAAIALSTSSVLVTGNERHLRRVHGLSVENWITS